MKNSVEVKTNQGHTLECQVSILKVNSDRIIEQIKSEYLYILRHNNTIGIGTSLEDAKEHLLIVKHKHKLLEAEFETRSEESDYQYPSQ